MAPSEIAADYDLTPEQVAEALAFYEAHRGEIEASLADEQRSEPVKALSVSDVADNTSHP